MVQPDANQVISMQHVWAGYGDIPVLEDINLTVKEMDFIGLIGPNGGGKSTLIKTILGLVLPYQGKVKIYGWDVVEGRRYVGYVPQGVDIDQIFPISVWEVVRMGLLGKQKFWKRTSGEENDKIMESMRRVEITDLAKKPIGELSGGQKQRVYIARALATNPKILLLDEPTSSVDAQTSKGLFELLHELNNEVTILLVSHDIGAISSYVKTIGCINRRLFYHGEKQITPEMLDKTYHCPIDFIAHGIPHRVFGDHDGTTKEPK